MYAIDFDSNSLISEQLPGKSVYSNGVWVFKADKDGINKLFEKLKFN